MPKGRRTFCSDDCVHRWQIKTNPGYVRQQVFKRDRGVCAVCSLDTEQWAKERRIEWAALHSRQGEPFTTPYYEASAARETFRRQYPHFFQRTSYWDADHIVPVVEGGGECDLDNYRTLCIPCHKEATKELAARRAEKRRAVAPVKPSSQQELF